MKRTLVILLSCVALSACERSFDISRLVGEGTVWMSFIPSNDYDTTFFIVQATTPLVGKTTPVLTSGETVEVKVNGQPLTLTKNERSVPDRLQYYSSTHVFSSGDKVEAVATVPGTGTVSASCDVPEPFPLVSWSVRRVPRVSTVSTMIVDIDYIDPGDGGYYGAAVMEYYEEDSQWADYDPETDELIWNEIKHSTHTSHLSPCPMTDEDGLAASSEQPVTVSPGYYNTLSGWGQPQRGVQIWCDRPGMAPAGTVRHMTFASRCYANPGRQEYRTGWIDNQNYKYKLILYRFSESFYNYLKAKYNESHNDFSEMGLAPASFVYSNVKGGAGVCGAYIVSESEWLELPPVE